MGMKPMDPIILGDPDQGGFRGLNAANSNNDLAHGQSPDCHNAMVSDTGLESRKGSQMDNAAEIVASTGITGLHRHMDGTDYHTYAKCGTRVYDVKATGVSDYVIAPVAAGDASGQLVDTNESGMDSAYTLLTELRADYIAHCAVGTLIHTLLTELRTDYIAHCALVGGSPCHSAADTVNNDPTAIASTSVADMITAANSLKAHYNAHDTETGVYHLAAGTAHQIASDNATDFTTLITLVNELRADYEVHRIDDDCHGLIDTTNAIAAVAIATTGNVHATADTVNNAPTAIASTNVADMITTANSLKTKQNAHDAEYGTYHLVAGTAHQVSADNATTLATLITLINAEKAAHGAHLADAVAHAGADGTNVIAADDAAIDPNLASWTILGANSGNTNAGVLYWKLTNSTTTRTVDLYKNSNGAAENKVATGSRTGDGAIILAAANASGITGSVTVAYSGDGTILSANTLTFGVLAAGDEIESLSWDNACFFCDGISLYHLTTGNASAITWLDEDGASTSGWTLLPTPAALVLDKEHIWWFDKNSSRVGFTKRGYHDRVYENTAAASTYGSWVACDADDGAYLTALVRLPYGGGRMAFKAHKSFLITGDFDDASDTLDVQNGPPQGAYSQKAAISCPDGWVRWYGPDGIWQYHTNAGLVCISLNKQLQLNIQSVLAGISSSNRTKCCLGYSDHKLLFFYPYGSSTHCDRGLALDLNRMEWQPIWAWNVSRLCPFEDDTIRAGWADLGYVKQLFVNNDDDGAPIAGYYATKYYGKSMIEQILDSIRGRVTAGRSLTFGWRSDAATGISGSVTFTYGAAPVVWGNRDNPGGTGTFTWGDRGTPGSGSSWSDRDARVIADFALRVIAGQRFQEIQFWLSWSSTSAVAIDFFETRSFFSRRVV